MNLRFSTIVASLVLFAFVSQNLPQAMALPPFWKEFEAKYVKPDSQDEKDKAFVAVVTNEKTGKCNVCHVEGQKKTVRNTYGAELDKLVDKANFAKERLEAEPDKVKQEIVAALDKIAAARSVAGDDKSPTFGELIGQGKLPGTVIAVAAAPATPQAPAATPAAGPVTAANSAEIVAKITALGGAVRQVAMNDDSVEVDFHLGGQKLNDEGLAAVKAVNKVIELHLKDTQITDAGLANIAGMNTLVRLHLEQTKVSDAGLEQLKGLSNLAYLNLYNTGVTDAGLEHLKPLANLRHLYLFGTKVTDDGVNKLKQALPNVQVVK